MDQARLNTLENILDRDIHIAQQLNDLLEAEKKALIQRKPETLNELISQKLVLLDQLEKNHKEKNQLTHHKDSDVIDWDEMLGKLQPNSQSTLKKLENFKEVLGNVEHLNKVNAKIASRMERSVAELIHVIKGNINQQTLYTQQGNAKLDSQNHTIAKA